MSHPFDNDPHDSYDVWKDSLPEQMLSTQSPFLSDEAFEANRQAYLDEEAAAKSIIRCHHFEGKKQRRVPCPPTCPRQSWPTSKFRSSLFGGRWVLKKER